MVEMPVGRNAPRTPSTVTLPPIGGTGSSMLPSSAEAEAA
jgi:hypothetical protein